MAACEVMAGTAFKITREWGNAHLFDLQQRSSCGTFLTQAATTTNVAAT